MNNSKIVEQVVYQDSGMVFKVSKQKNVVRLDGKLTFFNFKKILPFLFNWINLMVKVKKSSAKITKYLSKASSTSLV